MHKAGMIVAGLMLFVVVRCAAGTGVREADLRCRILYGIGNSDAADSLGSLRGPRLMPENTGFVERELWGERGVLREAGIASPLTPQARKGELSLRRSMLVAHQVSGFVTFGLLAASCYYGQRVLDGHVFESEQHSALVKYAIASYVTTAALSVLSPPPLIRREESSTTTIHRTLAWIHFGGMVLTPIIGRAVWHLQGTPSGPVMRQNNGAARFHQISAYTTTATLGVALAVMTF